MPRTSRRALLAAPLLAAGLPARAQDAFPSRPVRLIVPFPPGQAADIFARLVADELSRRWPQRVVVENRAGGAGAIGMEAVARAPGDGYTIGVGTSGTLGVNPSLMPNLPYNAETDFAPITKIFTVALVVIAHPSFASRTIGELIAAAKASPGEIQYASAGPGTAQHMAAELFAHMAGIRMTHVPYRGSGPALTDVMAGNVKLMFDSLASALPAIRAGSVRALAVTSAERAPQLPETPAIAESGLKGYAAVGWSGLVAPAATPAAIIGRVNADVVDILGDPQIAARIVELGGVPDPGTPDQYAAFIRAEIAKWREVARVANVRLQG